MTICWFGVRRGWRSVAAIASAAGCAAIASAEPAREVSPDGRTVAVPGEVAGGPMIARTTPFAFEPAPSWQLDLRRQVGGLAVADFNDDGENDLFVVLYTSNSFPPYDTARDFMLLGVGGGLSSTPGWEASIETHTAEVLVADLNGDELPDAVTVHGGSVRSDAVRIYENAPGGLPTAATTTSSIPGRAWGTAGVLADFDRDEDLDLVISAQGLGQFDPFRPLLRFDNVNGSIGASPVWQSLTPAVQNGLAAADFNGDEWPDLLSARWVNFESGIYLNDGTGVLEGNPSWTTGADGTDKGAAAADVDGDGDVDPFFGGDPSTGFTNNGDGTYTPAWMNTDPFSGPESFEFFDVDGDGDADLGEIHFSTGRAFIYENVDGVLSSEPAWSFDASEVGTALTFGDINGDGLADLILGYSGNTSVRVFLALPQSCAADLAEPAGELDFFDVLAYLALFEAQDASADLAEPMGLFDFFDVLAYLALFDSGC